MNIKGALLINIAMSALVKLAVGDKRGSLKSHKYQVIKSPIKMFYQLFGTVQHFNIKKI